MAERRLIGTDLRPVGRQGQPLRVTRRAFVGAGLATPVSIGAVVGEQSKRVRKKPGNEVPSLELRFFEGPVGIRVTSYRDNVLVSQWQLPRRAFGPRTVFLLRTLMSGADKGGYELLVGDVQSGALTQTRHYFTFIHNDSRWKVRMRSELWGAEITSTTIAFEELCGGDASAWAAYQVRKKALSETANPRGKSQTADAADPPELQKCGLSFDFQVNGAEISSALGKMLQGHLHCTGLVQLTFDKDCVWLLEPYKGQGRIKLQPFQLPLPRLEFAWCEPNGAQTVPGADRHLGSFLPESSVTPNEAKSAHDDPVFCATGALEADAAVTQHFSGAASVTGQLASKELSSFLYLSKEWQRSAGVRVPPGILTLSGQWSFDIRCGGRTALRGVVIGRGSLETWRAGATADGQLQGAFTGTAPSEGHYVFSRIGRLQVKGWSSTGLQQSAELPRIALSMDFQAAQMPAVLASVDVPLLLLESELGPTDADFSNFTFASTLLHAFYRAGAESALQIQSSPGSILWLGAASHAPGGVIARIDLSRARLEVAKAQELLSLSFLFSRFFLIVDAKGVRLESATALCENTGRAVPSADPATGATAAEELIDTRPILVVEFPPQHMFEQALFRPGLPGFPEVRSLQKEEDKAVPTFTVALQDFGKDPQIVSDLKAACEVVEDPISFPGRPADFLKKLRLLSSISERTTLRKRYQEWKIGLERKEGSKEPGPFETFAKDFGDYLNEYLKKDPASVPDDQVIYIGPYGMDPDVYALAREAMQNSAQKIIDKHLQHLLDQADDLVSKIQNVKADDPKFSFTERWARRIYELLTGQPSSKTLSTCDAALLKETAAGTAIPEFELFRTFYREQMTVMAFAGQGDGTSDIGEITSTPCDLEYFCRRNRDWGSSKAALEERERQVRIRYLTVLSGTDSVPDTVQARLANPSRLAFRVSCEVETGSVERKSKQRDGYRLPFTLAVLSNWGQYELAVTPRAQAIVTLDEAGRPLSGSDAAGYVQRPTAPSEDAAMLRLLNFRSGRFVSAEERLSDVESALARAPLALETAIEVPARLILSPSQRALWRTPQNLASQVARYLANEPHCSKDEREQKKSLCRHEKHTRETPSKPTTSSSLPVPLWNAALVVDNPPPALRAVHSPDLRPGFVRRGLELMASDSVAKESLRTAAISAPPRGPRAPWTLGPEEGDPRRSTASEVTVARGGDKNTNPLAQYLAAREAELDLYKNQNSAVFRSSLDAYDRHELVILSSAWGLPVGGRRDPSGQVQVTSTSSQVEPPEGFQPVDLDPGTALYRPRPLKVQELRLTALGGTFRHDTEFVPPLQARHVEFGPLFDALSIERWQHWTVLGRDVFAEVVYKGYLLPLSHRASLIKQTERIFLRAADANGVSRGRIRAYLRQRLFIRIGDPNKTFPALGQPNLGRQFPAKSVCILTTNTPDIVDPSQDEPPAGTKADQADNSKSQIYTDAGPAPGGRLFPASGSGLAFWPRTSRISGSEVKFDVLIDNAFVSLPMIFVDNVAANDEKLLRSVVHYYNNLASPDAPSTDGVTDEWLRSQAEVTLKQLSDVDPTRHWRTVDFAGQALRYCDELKPGSATHKTLYWTLKASGLRTPLGPVVSVPSGAANDSQKLPWEGTNERFYYDRSLDAVDQPPFYPAVETARIRIDQVDRFSGQSSAAALVQFDGYYVAAGFLRENNTTLWRDTLEIYLNILNEVRFTMGSAGDRSGGIYRPDSPLVALSRQRGPMGGIKGDTPIIGRLFTRAGQYDTSAVVSPAPQSQAAGSSNVRSPDPHAGAYQGYFPDPSSTPGSDVKILGLVTLHDLVRYIKLTPAAEGLPLLHEVKHYGLAGAAAGAELIRNNVILPLKIAVGKLRERWKSLDGKIQDFTKLGNQLTTLSIKEVFPEIDSALVDLETALGKSATESNEVAFYSTLGEVYECGRRLVDALGRASANPIERAYIALSSTIKGELQPLQGFVDQIASNVQSLKVDWQEPVAEYIADAVVGPVAGNTVDAHIAGIARFLPGVLANALEPEGLLQLRGTLKSSMQRLFEGQPFNAVLNDFVAAIKAQVQQVDTEVLSDTLRPFYRAAQNLYTGLQTPDLNALVLAGDGLLTLLLPQKIEAAPASDDLLLSLYGTAVSSLHKILETFTNSTKRFLRDPIPSILSQLDEFAQALEKLQNLPQKSKGAVERLRDALRTAKAAITQATQELAKILQGLDSATGAQSSLELKVDELRIALRETATLLQTCNDFMIVSLPLPPDTPDDLDVDTDHHIGSQLRGLIRSLLDAQDQALQQFLKWTDLGSTEAASVLDVVRENLKALKVAADGVYNSKDLWSSLLKDRTAMLPALRKLPGADAGTAAIADSVLQIAEEIVEWWGAVLESRQKGSRIAAIRVAQAAKAVAGPLAEAYQKMTDTREELFNSFNARAPGIAILLLVPMKGQTQDQLRAKSDQLTADRDFLQRIAAATSEEWIDKTDDFARLREFVGNWLNGTATPLKIVQQAGRNSMEAIRAQLLGMVDLSVLRDQVETYIKQLIPASATLNYDFQASLDENARHATGGIFVPHEGCQLTISCQTTVNFLEPKVTVQAGGEIGPFDIKLVGDLIDALTIRFAGATFRSDGGASKCDVQYRDFQIGPALKFVEELASWFKPKEGSGFYLVPLSNGIGIEAGYGLNIGTIALGDVSFFNVSLNAALRLRFDDQPATVVTSLSRRDAPFTISAAPYGGSGFFAIEADAHGVVGFEASFEYGGAGAFSYGPLSGSGRLMIGVYIRQKKRADGKVVTDIYATFFAGGSASIWVFSFGASLYVCATMHENTMVGDATFTFSFSMGLVDFDYRVNVHKEISWGGGGGGPPPVRRDAPLPALGEPNELYAAEFRVDTWCHSEHWGRHRDYSDLGIEIDMEEFA